MPSLACRLAVLALGVLAGCTDGASAAVAKARAGDPVPLCHAVCERVSACKAVDEFEGVSTCTTHCVESEELWTDPCRDAAVSLSACEIERPCEELRSILRDLERADTAPCETERRAVLACRQEPEPFIYFQF